MANNDVFDFASMLVQIPCKCVGVLLSNIVTATREIQEITKRTTANKHQCSRLSQRIIILVGFLQEQQFDDKVGQSIKFALVNFAMFLQSCVEFMNKFTNAGFLKRLWNNKDDLNRFNELHTEYSQHVADLTFGIASMAMFGSKSKDQQDQQLKSIRLLQETSIKSDENMEYNSWLITSIDSDQAKCEDETENIFLSGGWKYQHDCDDMWQDFSYFELVFNRENETLLGYGEDRLGRFQLNGSFCTCIQTIEMTWSYKDDKLNAEHQKLIKLQWNNDRKSFRGTFTLSEKSKDQTDPSPGEFEMALFSPLL